MVDPEVAKKIEEIRSDRRCGATPLSLKAAETLRLAAERSRARDAEGLQEELRDVGRRLVEARPSMAPIRNRVLHILKEVSAGGGDLSLLKKLTALSVEALIEESRAIASKISESASRLTEGKTVMTHSYSSTVSEALKRSGGVRVIATESRPLYEGRRLARELSEQGVPVTLITDASVGHFMPEVDVVLVGADSVLSDGSIINKVGTYPMALAAREANVPFYVACETYKFSDRLSGEVELEEMEAGEVVEEPPPGVKVRNVYFDVTPSSLVTGIVTEKGVLEPGEVGEHVERAAPPQESK
ncbi:MAG: translation initiation factor eIF-2B [Candidatus Geothermarchaeales archaeon]